MNRRQRQRKEQQRAHHQAESLGPNVLTADAYPNVKIAHIVPKFFQRNFAIDDKVEVWSVRDRAFARRDIAKAGTRRRYYRRTRPDGTPIDDMEASLASLESATSESLRQLVAGEPLTRQNKSAVAQLLGMQLARGPHFFGRQEELSKEAVSATNLEDFLPSARARLGDDAEALRTGLFGALTTKTHSLSSMLRIGSRLGGVLANMRWHLLDFTAPALAYSDHPVVVWPVEVEATVPFTTQQFGPLTAWEVRAPLSSSRAVVMTWADLPDPAPYVAESAWAAEINAFTAAQADREWMHTPGHPPRLADGLLAPLAFRLDGRYDRAAFETSERRKIALRYLERTAGKLAPKHFQMAEVRTAPRRG